MKRTLVPGLTMLAGVAIGAFAVQRAARIKQEAASLSCHSHLKDKRCYCFQGGRYR